MSRACRIPANSHKSCLIWDPPLSLVSSCTQASLFPPVSAVVEECQHFARSWVLGVSLRLHWLDLEVFELVHALVRGRRIRAPTDEDRTEHFLEMVQNNKDIVRSNYNSCETLDNRIIMSDSALTRCFQTANYSSSVYKVVMKYGWTHVFHAKEFIAAIIPNPSSIL